MEEQETGGAGILVRIDPIRLKEEAEALKNIQSTLVAKLIILFSIVGFTMYSQPDTLNKLNTAGKKTGYWKIYYNERFELAQDSSKARYYDYEQYINGDVFRYIYDKKDLNELKIKYLPKDPLKDAKLLNGEVLYYNKSNNLSYKDEFVKGVITKMHTYSYFLDTEKKYVLYHEELVDFTKPYNNSNNSYYFEIKDYKVLRDTWKIKKGYVIFTSYRKQKTIKL